MTRNPDSSVLSPTGGKSAAAVLRRDGEQWTVGYQGRLFRLKDKKGLDYLATLLRHPGTEFHAFDLMTGGSGAASGKPPLERMGADRLEELGLSKVTVEDAGAMLDAEAKASYRRQLGELREELEEAKALGKVERGEQIEAETEALTRELSRAVGIGGRDRRAGSTSERARLNVSRAIKSVLDKIAEGDAELGHHLEKSVRTGTFCCYEPGSRAPISWQLNEDAQSPLHPPRSAPVLDAATATSPLPFNYRTSFVGRERERGELRTLLEQATAGRGSLVMLGGSPGIGKTRIAAEIALEANRRGVRILVGRCYDREEPLPYSPFVEILEMAIASMSRSELREALGDGAADLARLVPKLKRALPDLAPAQELTPEQSRRALFNSYRDFVATMSQHRPLLLILDDLHLADESSLLLLTHLVRTPSPMSVLVIATYRDLDIESTPRLAKTQEELIREGLARTIRLKGLAHDSVGELVKALSGQTPPANLVDAIYDETEGNPFFVGEVFSHLDEEGILYDQSGSFRSDLKIDELDVPRNVRLVIGRRLQRLSSNARLALAVAAVIGRDFSFHLLEVMQEVQGDALLDALEEADRAGLIISTSSEQGRCGFAHELIRQTLLAQLSAPRRQRLHLRVADTIERVYANALEEHAAEVAHHLMRAGAAADAEKTIRYLTTAGERAIDCGAFVEGESCWRQALAVLGTMPQPERAQPEHRLHMRLAELLYMTKGAAEAQEVFARARTFAEKAGEARSVRDLFASWLGTMSRLEVRAAHALADDLLEAANRDGSAVALVWAHLAQGLTHYYGGDLFGAWQHLTDATAPYDEEGHASAVIDAGVWAGAYLALTAAILGLADTASTRAREAIEFAERIRKPGDVAFARTVAARLYALERLPHARESAESAVACCKQSGFTNGACYAGLALGLALTELGRCDEGVALVGENVDAYKATGNRLDANLYLGALAHAQGRAGHLEEAFVTVEEALSAAPDQEVNQPYVIWVRGELHLKTGARELAETDFREAIAYARRIGAKLFELRAALSLGRLLKSRGHIAKARNLLVPLYAGFTEGFDVPDLKDARALLDELNLAP